MILRWTALAIFASLLLLSSYCHEQTVLTLNSQNFEHATQAASGMTTGHWFVYFGGEEQGRDQQMWNLFAEQEREEKPWLLHAFVNVKESPEVAHRFSVQRTPAFILLRNSKAYRFNSASTTTITPDVVKALSEFSGGGWRTVKDEKIPPDHMQGPGWSTNSILAFLAGAAVIAVLAAVSGNYITSYLEAARPSQPKIE